MKKFKLIQIEATDDILCDICGKSCWKEADYEMATIQATWGYGSNKDNEAHFCEMCEECYDKVRGFIEGIGGQMQIESF